MGIIMALIFKKTLFSGEAVPFVMELPNYRMPGLRNVMQLLWDKSKDFLQRAFSIILIATIAVWFLKSFDFRFNLVDDPHASILASLAGLLVPIMKPAGLGDWRIVTSLICGFLAKESVVSTMEMLFAAGGVTAAISSATAAGILVFSLLYTPCVAAVAAIRRELGRIWAIYVVLWQCTIAWIAALIVRLITGA
jgi:ferrous iron transport protein B